MIAIALFAIALFAVAGALTARAVALPRVRATRTVQRIAEYGFAEVGVPGAEVTSDSFVASVGRLVTRRLRRERRAATRAELIAAGLHGTSVDTYFGWYVITGLGATLFMALFAFLVSAPIWFGIVLVAAGAVAGWALAPAYLHRRGQTRLRAIDHGIPELVDLLLVGVESGMTFQGALNIAAPRMSGPLGEEVRLFLQQQALGASTQDALQNMLDRSDTTAMRMFVRTISQGERYGVPFGDILRTLADEMRKHRQGLAEEQAQKTPVKILFPLVFLLLPALLLIIITPAVMGFGDGI